MTDSSIPEINLKSIDLRFLQKIAPHDLYQTTTDPKDAPDEVYFKI